MMKSQRMNAKKEFLSEVQGKTVLCAYIERGFGGKVDSAYALDLDYTPDDYAMFLESLDFVYDADFGEPELFGTIWYTDNTWSTRIAYHAGEEWLHKKPPEVPPWLYKGKIGR
jgi:hypothetical protein